MKKMVVGALCVMSFAAVRPGVAESKAFCGGSVSVSVRFANSMPSRARSTGYQAVLKNVGGPTDVKFSFRPGRLAEQFASTVADSSFLLYLNETRAIGLGQLKSTTNKSGTVPNPDTVLEGVNVTCATR